MNAQIDDVRWIPRLASAAGATVITGTLLVCLAFGFPTLASAQAVQRVAAAPAVTKLTAAEPNVSAQGRETSTN